MLGEVGGGLYLQQPTSANKKADPRSAFSQCPALITSWQVLQLGQQQVQQRQLVLHQQLGRQEPLLLVQQQVQELGLVQLQELGLVQQVQVLLLFYRKRPGQQPTERRSAETFSCFFL